MIKQETIDDILREMGEWVDQMESSHIYEVATGYVTRYVGRLESARKRELDGTPAPKEASDEEAR